MNGISAGAWIQPDLALLLGHRASIPDDDPCLGWIWHCQSPALTPLPPRHHQSLTPHRPSHQVRQQRSTAQHPKDYGRCPETSGGGAEDDP